MWCFLPGLELLELPLRVNLLRVETSDVIEAASSSVSVWNVLSMSAELSVRDDMENRWTVWGLRSPPSIEIDRVLGALSILIPINACPPLS